MCSARKTIASSDTLRCSESTRKRGQRGRAQAPARRSRRARSRRSTAAAPRRPSSGSGTSRARSGVAQRHVHAATRLFMAAERLAGQSPTVRDALVRSRAGGPAARAPRATPERRRPARTRPSWRCSHRCRWRRRRSPFATAPRGRSRGGVDDVVHGAPVLAPAPDRRARGRKAAGEDTRPSAPGAEAVAAVVVGHANPRQPPAGGRARRGDVAAEAHEHAAVASSRPPPPPRSAAHALAVAPRSSRTPAGCGRGRSTDRGSPSASRSELAAQCRRPGGPRASSSSRGRCEQLPVAVIPGQLERPAHRRIDVAAGQLRPRAGRPRALRSAGERPVTGGPRARSP